MSKSEVIKRLERKFPVGSLVEHIAAWSQINIQKENVYYSVQQTNDKSWEIDAGNIAQVKHGTIGLVLAHVYMRLINSTRAVVLTNDRYMLVSEGCIKLIKSSK